MTRLSDIEASMWDDDGGYIEPGVAIHALRAVIDEALADALGDTFSPSVMDDLTRRVHDSITAAPHLTAQAVVSDTAVEALDALVEAAKIGVPADVRQMVDDFARDVRAGLLTAAPEASRIAVLEARLAALGYPSCKCHPADDDSERCLPDPAQWIAEVRGSAPSATREELSALLLTFLRPPKHGGSWTYSPDEAADALLARFTITPKEDR